MVLVLDMEGILDMIFIEMRKVEEVLVLMFFMDERNLMRNFLEIIVE